MINIQADSRKIKKGDIFVALPGILSDGHDYINKAIELGASKLIVQKPGNYAIDYEIVPDTRAFLVKYLKENYGHIIEEMTIVGYTGTNGKTTSAYLLYDALTKLGVKAGYIGTIGYYLDGKVKALANTSPDVCDMFDLIVNAYDKGHKTIVIEASSQGLHGGRLEGINFDYAVFTNLTQDHLDYHKTMDEYAAAKKLLFDKLKPNGLSILNKDDEVYTKFITNNTVFYGFQEADYQITDVSYEHTGTTFNVNSDQTFNSKLLGEYNVYNLLTVIIILEKMGYSYNQIKEIIPNLICPPGRMDVIIYKSNSIIVDYAHTPDAIEKIIDTVKEVAVGSIYTVFGCTGERDRTKRPIMTKLVTDKCEYAIITNDDPHFEDPNQIVADMTNGITNDNYEVIIDRKKAIEKGIRLLKDNDILLILGKGHEEVMIIGNEHIPFNDKKVILELLEKEF